MALVDTQGEAISRGLTDQDIVSVAHLIEHIDPSDAAVEADALAMLGVRLTSDDDAAAITPYARYLGLIELVFSHFKDGRPFSTAVTLRRDHGFGGDLRASGDFLPDQALFLLRCSFSSFDVSDQFSLDQFQNSLKAYSSAYQEAPHTRAGDPVDVITDLRRNADEVEAA